MADFFSTPKTPPLPKPQPAPEVLTEDTARQSAEADIQANQRKGALANVLSQSNTGSQLSQSAPEGQGALKRLLGS